MWIKVSTFYDTLNTFIISVDPETTFYTCRLIKVSWGVFMRNQTWIFEIYTSHFRSLQLFHRIQLFSTINTNFSHLYPAELTAFTLVWVNGHRCFGYSEVVPLVKLSDMWHEFHCRYYKKVAVVKEKQKRNADEESIEDVDDEEFEKMIGNLLSL